MTDIFLDDIRDPPAGFGTDDICITVRTADICIEMLQNYAGSVETLSLDHDLADAHYEGKASKEKTGYDVALWLEEQAASGNLAVIPRWMLCHSMNPVGKAKILKCIDRIKEYRDGK